MHFKKLVLQTAHLKTLEEFYSSILELNAREIHGKEVLIKIGDTDLHFVEGAQKEPFYHFAVNIPANKIEEARAWLSKKTNLL
ncbi:MAG TPA: hypothetical protein VFP87_08285, partial [Chitinophagaceae bacterium]|nr:hypothetical protein [Chitinophagaceae bacterium]